MQPAYLLRLYQDAAGKNGGAAKKKDHVVKKINVAAPHVATEEPTVKQNLLKS